MPHKLFALSLGFGALIFATQQAFAAESAGARALPQPVAASAALPLTAAGMGA